MMIFQCAFQKMLLALGFSVDMRQLRQRVSRLAILGLLLTLGLLSIDITHAQSSLDGFNPNADSSVLAIGVQADGKILIGGFFTTVSGQTRNHIARLNVDGTLDTGFNPNADNDVRALAVQDDGKILVGGNFTTISGQTRNRIARINTDGTLDTGFNPDADSTVFALAVQQNDKILIGGGFTTIGGQTRNHIARLNTDGTLDAGFNPDANNDVRALVVEADGQILLGGSFSTVGGQTRNCIARLNTDGTLDAGFNPNADNSVFALAVQADGKILAGGSFTTVSGQTHNRIARINTDGTIDAGFNSDANNTVFALAIQADGKILAGGAFTYLSGDGQNRIARLNVDGTLDADIGPDADNDVLALAVQGDGKILAGGNFSTIGGQTRNFIARLFSNGLVEMDTNPGADNDIFALAVQANGQVIVGGDFTDIGGFGRNRLTRLNLDGTIDSDFNPNANGTVLALAVQPDGKILVGGDFTNIAGEAHGFIARIDENGTADPSFGANADNTVQSIVVQADGKILVGGNFTSISGADRSRIVRLNTDGSLDGEFNSAANSDVHAIAIQPDGKIVIGGFFTAAGGEARNRIARLNTDGTLDSFNPDADENVDSLALQPDGKILAGGNFTFIGGQARNHFARLNSDGTADTGFDPNVNGVVYALSLQADGGILIGGSFDSVGGQPRNRIARVNTAGTLDTGFDPNADGTVFSMAMQTDGTIVVGGGFTNIGGQTRNRIARLTNEAAFQTLSANSTGTTITWSRSGTSPEVDRVTFEQSTDFGQNWTSLGDGARVGVTSNWQLTGLALPIQQNLLLRARGYPLAGNFGGGDPSVYESVRLVYLTGANTAPTFPTVATLTRQQGSATINSTIATVDDAETAAGSLTVTAITVPAGITVTNIVNTGGTITADVAAGCSATIGSNTVVLQVSDGSLTATGNLTVNVSANTAPTLTYNNASVLTGAATTINPATGPSDNGSVATIVLFSQGTYTGTIMVNNASGAVSISNAAPVGTHTITIRATDDCGAVTDASFTLEVQACSYSISPTVQSFAASGGNGTVAVTAGESCAWTVVNNAPTWITVTSSGSGQSNGTVEYTVSPNSATTPRSGTLTIAGETFVVTQIAAGMIVAGDFSAGIPPAWEVEDGGTQAVYNNTGTPLTWTTLNPCNREIPPPFSGAFAIVDAACTIPGAVMDEELRLPPFDATGLGSVFVEFYSQFEWDISVPDNKGDVDVSTDGGQTWLNVLRLENGSDGVPTPVLKSINITPYIANNPANVLVRLHYYGVSPPATLRAALGKAHWGVDFGVYSYAFTPSSQSFPASGGTGSIAVATSVAVPSPQGEWTAVSNVQWITVTSGASVRGNGTVTFTVDSNGSGLRTGTLTISGRTFTVTQSCVPSPAGLTAWYSAEDNANDRQGSNNGTLHNSATFAAGFVGKAFSLDGVDDYVSTTLDVQPSALPNVTWEAWVYPTRVNAATRQSIFSTDDGGFDRAVTIEAGSDHFGVFTGAGVWVPVAVTLNQWQHIAVVYTPSGIEFYKNGVKYTFNGAPSGQATANRFHIGRNPSAAEEYYEGLVDEVGIYNRALTEAEIQTVVTASSAGRCGVCPTTTVGPQNSTLPAGTTDQPYSQSFTATGGDAPYIFTLNTGSLPAGLAIAPDGVLSGTPTSSGTFNFTVRTTDANGCSGVGTYSLTIAQACGTIIIGPGSIASGNPGIPYSQQFTQTGGIGSVTFSTSSTLPAGITLSGGGLLAGTTNQTGSFPITIQVMDSNGCIGMANYTLVIGCPVVTLSSLPGGTAGTAYNPTVTVSPSGGSYTFAVTAGSLPPGLSLATGGAITGTPTQAGTFNFTITATGPGSCTGSRTYSLVIQCPAITLSPVALPNGAANTAYSQTVSATPSGTTYSFAVTSGALPPGLSLASGGAITGSPTQSGTFSFRITATGWGSCTGFRDYMLTVGCPTITITPASLPGGTIGVAYSQSVSGTPAGIYSYSVTSGALPIGLTLNGSTGVITGTPTASGSFAFTITALAGGAGGCSGSRSYTVAIGCPAISFTPASLTAGTAGSAYSQAFTVSPSGTYTFSVAQGSLPSGLVLNPTTGVLGGTPSVTGSYAFSIKAAAGNGCSATQSYTLAVNCPAIAISPNTLPNGTIGAAYSQSLSATPATGSYSFSLSSGSLPAGLSLSSAGFISGTPTTSGVYGFTITASGFGGCASSPKSYSITIGSGGCPTITLPASLPGGHVGSLYNQSVAASPAGSYSYTLTGTVPPGVTFYNAGALLFGYPVALGSYTFTITATDASTCTASKTYTIVISGAFARTGDFDGDGKSDFSVWRGKQSTWMIVQSSSGEMQDVFWGAEYAPYDDVAVPADYDGDGKTDVAVFRRGNGHWYVKQSSDGATVDNFWGLGTDVPVPADYDGDGKADIAVWRGAQGRWYIVRSSDGQTQIEWWGAEYAPYHDLPVPADYDGDGKTDIAVFRRSTGVWYIKQSSDGQMVDKYCGLGTDMPVPADYDGDGKADIAVWRASEGRWYIVRSSDNQSRIVNWGMANPGDVPVPADYDGDGKTDIAIWRASEGAWYVKCSADGSVITKTHGQLGDRPVNGKQQ
ncbi:MAG: putative Ig domain-containing protein [Acidobacteriota bacterium]